MRGRVRLLGLVAVFALLLTACDWSMFRFGPEGTAFNPETTVGVANVHALAPSWSVPSTSHSYVVEGSNTVITEGTAFDATTGKVLWTAPPDSAFGAIAGNVVYGTNVVSDTSATLQARDLRTGAVQWSVPIGVPTTAPTLAADGTVIQTIAGGSGGGDTIEAFDAQTGASRWVVGFGPETYAGPTIHDGTAYFVAQKYDSGDDHTYLWAFDTTTKTFRWTVQADHCGPFTDTTPVVANGHVYANGHTFDASTGAFQFDWAVCPNLYVTENLSASPQTLFVPYLTSQSQPALAALDANTGALQWSIPWVGGPPDQANYPKGTPADAPAVSNGVIFGVEVNAVDFSVGGTHLVADNAASGARLWDSTRNPANSYGDPILANGVLYAQSTGHLDAFHLSTQ